MRVVGGALRGRAIAEPASRNVRPTGDRVREALFNVLVHAHGDRLQTRVMDLFAGTGALGIEALSRGAPFALFVDRSAEGRGLIRTNIEALGLGGRARISRRDATDLGPFGAGAAGNEPFGLVFADPPYGQGLGERAATALVAGGWVQDDALLVLEEERDALPDAIPGWVRVDVRLFGGTAVGFFKRRAP